MPSLTHLFWLTADSYFNRGLQNEKFNSFGSSFISRAIFPNVLHKTENF